MKPEELIAWLSFSRLTGVSARARVTLLQQFGSIDSVFSASRARLNEFLADTPQAVDALLSGPNTAALEADLTWLAQDGCHLVTWFDGDYPPLLRQLMDPPIALYVRGDPTCLTRPQIAIVGSRNPTPAGRDNARAFAQALSQAGFAVTSGLALGIDGAAHQAALEAGGVSIAVAATGLDRVYPPRHRKLAHAIAAQGALVSEFFTGTPPRADNFPLRNRVISGMSLGVLVVEAALQSGSRITARLAAEQGREVFAIPGSIHSPLARGCHALIRQGAKLVETAQDILEELEPLARVAIESNAPRVPPPQRDLEPRLAELLESIGYDPMTVDALVERSGLTADVVSSMLLQLELLGLIAVGAGGNYSRTA